jgi:hypothetical protein
MKYLKPCNINSVARNHYQNYENRYRYIMGTEFCISRARSGIETADLIF